jgi:hypothetical protein
MSFPKELNLGSNKPIAAYGKPSINRYRSDNSSYNNNDTIRIEVPTGRNGQYLFPKDNFLEGSVKISCTNGATASSVYIDQSVYALFNRIRVIHGSTVLEDCLYVNRVWTSIMDIQINESERRSLGITHLIGDQLTAVAAYNQGTFGTKFINLPGPQVASVDSVWYDFAFPLPSAVFGTLATKAIPIGLCGSSSLYIELELASPNVAFVGEVVGGVASTALISAFTVQNIYYNAKITTLPSDVNNALLETTGGIINLPAVAYKSEQKNFASAAGATSFNDKFSFQFSSIKSFYFFVMNTAATSGSILYRSITSRPRANITDYFLSINGEAYPSQTIQSGPAVANNGNNGSARMYAELLRSWDLLGDVTAGGILNYQNYTQSNLHTAPLSQLTTLVGAADYGLATLQQRFIAGIDLDRFNHSSDVLMSGTDTQGQLITLFVNYLAATDALTLYAYVMYDVMYNIEYGQITART